MTKIVRKMTAIKYRAREGCQTAAIQACLTRKWQTYTVLHAKVSQAMPKGKKAKWSQTLRHLSTLNQRREVEIQNSN